MSTLLQALIFTALTTVSDFLGVWVVVKKLSSFYIFRLLEHFAVGALLALAFLDLLPEALEKQSPENILLVVVVSIVGFYFLERLISWSHHLHDVEEGIHAGDHSAKQAVVFTGATLEEFIDGIVIGLSVALSDGSLILPITTSIAVFAHEFPDSVSRAVAFMRTGLSSSQALKRVLLTTLGSFAGAVAAVVLSSLFASLLPFLAAIAVAAFIYIAVSHLIPDLHHKVIRRNLAIEIAAMISGVVLIRLIGFLE